MAFICDMSRVNWTQCTVFVGTINRPDRRDQAIPTCARVGAGDRRESGAIPALIPVWDRSVSVCDMTSAGRSRGEYETKESVIDSGGYDTGVDARCVCSCTLPFRE